jgi:methyl-accepting chemotaxis protein
MIIVGGIAITRVVPWDHEIDKIVLDKYPKVLMLENVKDNLSIIARGLRNMLLVETPEEAAKEAKRVTDSRDAIGKIFGELEKVVQSDAGKEQLKLVTDARTAYIQTYMVVIKLIEANDKVKAKQELLTNVRRTQTAYFAALDKMVEHQNKEVERVGKQAAESATQTRNIIIALIRGRNNFRINSVV